MSLLTLNAGSSSLKFALFDEPAGGGHPQARLRGQIAGLGGAQPHLKVSSAQGRLLDDQALTLPHGAPGDEMAGALSAVFDGLARWAPAETLRGIGHRVVHGGTRFQGAVLLDEDVRVQIARLTPLAPLHQPFNLAGMRQAAERFPGVPQAACFDTAFHRGHAFAQESFALPRELYEAGVRRYGFHGLSYDYIASRLAELDPTLAAGRVVAAHLGSGASLCALRAGQSVATSMGFSALDGLPMGTRCGQIDPGVLLWLMTERGLDASGLSDLLYRQSGLKGLSGLSGDLRVLHDSDSPQAAQAIDYFIAHLCEQIAAMVAVLGGLDGLVFTAGIGENDPVVRHRTLQGLGFLGVIADEAANQTAGADTGGLISADGSRVQVRVIPTDEEQTIARQLQALIA